jgi:hypothetical protein
LEERAHVDNDAQATTTDKIKLLNAYRPHVAPSSSATSSFAPLTVISITPLATAISKFRLTPMAASRAFFLITRPASLLL